MRYDDREGLWAQTIERWEAGETGFATKGAESLDEIRDRVLPIWHRLADRFEGATYIVVAHGAVIKVILRDLTLGSFIWNAFRYPNLGVTETIKARDTWNVVRIPSERGSP